MYNLAVELDERFAPPALAHVRHEIERRGLEVRDDGADDRVAAWIDAEFGGWWSVEARNGRTLTFWDAAGPVGFVTVDVRGMRFPWLRGAARDPATGLFGPVGVARSRRGSGLGAALTIVGLGMLHASGYRRALIAAVTGERLLRWYARVAGARPIESFERDALFGTPAPAAILASGNGTNAQAVLEATRDGRLPVRPIAVVCNRPQARVLERTRDFDVMPLVVTWERGRESRADYDTRLIGAIEALRVELVLLLGWMHLLNRAFVERFPETLNLHPAFLPFDPCSDTVIAPDGVEIPAFRGAHAVRDALRAGSPWVGASVHRITVEVDRGPVLVRAPLRVHRGEEEAAVMERLHPLEHRVVLDAVRRWAYERNAP